MCRALLSLFLLALPAVTHAADHVEVSPPPWGTRSYADVVDQVLPAVVSLLVIKVSAVQSGQGKMTARRQSFFGFGFIIDPKGIIVTNRHVIQGAAEITAILADDSQTRRQTSGSVQRRRSRGSDGERGSSLAGTRFRQQLLGTDRQRGAGDR